MTFKEATAQAIRELGVKERDIKLALSYAEGMVPNTPDALVKPGKEREFIDFVKSSYTQGNWGKPMPPVN